MVHRSDRGQLQGGSHRHTTSTPARHRSETFRSPSTPNRPHRTDFFSEIKGERFPYRSEELSSNGDFYSDPDFLSDFIISDDTDEDDESEFTFNAPDLDTFELPTAHVVPSSNGLTEPASNANSSILKQKSLEVGQIVSSNYTERRENGSVEYSGDLIRVSGRVPSLFSWLHLNPETMNFSEFSEIAISLPNLSAAESDEISQFLKRVGSKYEKPIRTASGRNGWYMEPVVATKSRDQARFPAVDGVSVGSENYVFCCLPYFRLELHNSTALPQGGHLHPSQPLFQSVYPSTGRQRDLQQAVCKLQGIPESHCFHVSSLWCLMISDKHILTCAKSLSIENILTDLMTIRDLPAPGALAISPPALTSTLQVAYDTRLWLFSINQCDTWFKFICRLSDLALNFEEEFLIRWRRRVLEPSQWPKLIAQAKRFPTRIQVVRRKHAKLSDAEDRIVSSLHRQPEASTGSTIDHLTVIGEDEKESRSRSHSPDGTITGSTDSRKKPSDSSKDSTYSKERATLSHQTYLPPRKTANPPFNSKEFHALLWLAVSPVNYTQDTARKASSEQLQTNHQEKIESYLKRLHGYMETNDNTRARIDYQNITEKSFEDVNRVLTGLKKITFDSEQAQSLQMRFASAVESAFQIFLPVKWRSSISSRYWGAIIAILTALPSKNSDRFLSRALRILEEIGSLGKRLKTQLSAGKGPDPKQMDTPREFARAWYHLFLCMLSWSPKNMRPALKQSQSCRKFLRSAQRKMLKMPDGPKLSELEVVLPTGVLVFAAHALIKDITNQYSKTRDAYWEYYGELQINVRANPLDRSHQQKVSAFIDEIRIIRHHIDSQKQVLQDLQDRLSSSRLQHNDRDQIYSGPQWNMLKECISTLDEKDESFDELLVKAETLMKISIESIMMNKDRQETAIFIFTVVTVIFLPLSTVSSYLGMNTSDIRGMQSKQWVFWAAAVPLTLVILVLARLWAFPGLTRSFQMLMSNMPASQIPQAGMAPTTPPSPPSFYVDRREGLTSRSRRRTGFGTLEEYSRMSP